MAVCIGAHAPAGGDRGALGIGDSRVCAPGRVLGTQRQPFGRRDVDFPGMMEIQIGQIARHQFRIGQPGILVLGGEFRDAHGFAHGLLDGVRRVVHRAGAALAAAAIDGDGKSPVALPLHRFQLPHAHGDRKALVVADRGLGLVGSQPAGQLDGLTCRGFQRLANPVRIHENGVFEGAANGEGRIVAGRHAVVRLLPAYRETAGGVRKRPGR